MHVIACTGINLIFISRQTMADKQESKPVPVATDGGWGWVVLLGAFVAYFIADGWSYSFGLLFPELVWYFAAGKGKTALIGALLYGAPLLMSPIVCALTTVYGCRPIGIAGGALTVASFIISTFATSVDFLCVTTGLLASIGLCMTYIPSLVIVTYYFEKRRGLATGLAVTGSGLGAIAFPPLMECLFELYSWRGALLITGGICLHIIVASALFRSPPLQVPVADSAKDNTEIENPKLRNIDWDIEKIPTERSSYTGRRYMDHNRTQRQENAKPLYSCPNIFETATGNASEGDTSADETVVFEPLLLESTNSWSKSCPALPTHEEGCHQHDQVQPTKTSKCCQDFGEEIKTVMMSMLDKSLMKNWPYLLFCASSFILYLWVGFPYIYLIDRASGLNIAGDLMFLLSLIGIGRTVGQIVLGILGDHPKVKPITIYGVSIVIVGLSTILVPFCHDYASLAVFSVTFGFFVSVTYALQMMCVVNAVGLARATSAFGLLQLVQGVATLLGTPVGGKICNCTGILRISCILFT